MLFFLEKGEFTEFKKNIVQHIYLLTCNTLRYMEPVAGKPLQGKVLGTFPWFDLDPVAACIISDYKGIYAIIFGKIDKGFLVILYHFRVQAVDLDIKGKQLLRRRKIVGRMEAIISGGFQGNNHPLDLRIFFKSFAEKLFDQLYAALCVFHRDHPDKIIL